MVWTNTIYKTGSFNFLPMSIGKHYMYTLYKYIRDILYVHKNDGSIHSKKNLSWHMISTIVVVAGGRFPLSKRPHTCTLLLWIEICWELIFLAYRDERTWTCSSIEVVQKMLKWCGILSMSKIKRFSITYFYATL